MKNTLVFDARKIQDGVFNKHEVEVPATQINLDFEEVEFISPVRGSVELLRHSEENIYVKAGVSTIIELQCGRCLEMFQMDIEASIEVQFTPDVMDEDMETVDSENEERYYDGETFDLSEDTRRALVIQIPVWSLCSEMCEGLCAGCGTNLNDADCICDVTDVVEVTDYETHSPFAELAQLLDAAKSEEKLEQQTRKELKSQNGTSKT